MIVWLRNLILIVFILSVIYTLLSVTGRIRARKRLQTEFEAKKLEGEPTEFITQGLVKYDKSMRPKLFLFVFIIPILIVATLIYLAQYA